MREERREGSIECVFFLRIVGLEADGWVDPARFEPVITLRFHSDLYAILQYSRYNIMLYVIATASNYYVFVQELCDLRKVNLLIYSQF